MGLMTKKQIAVFKEDAEHIVRSMGATDAPPNLSQFQLDTNIGTLWISVKEGWIACCFEDVAKAKEANLGDRLNRFSGKWNWHEGTDGLSMFEHQLYLLMDKPEEYASLCVKKLCAKSLGVDLTDDQAVTLWRECREFLMSKRLFLVVREIESAQSGSLDTMIREHLSEAISQTLVGMEWPSNGDSDEVSDNFVIRMTTVIGERGYAIVEPPEGAAKAP